MDFMKKYRGYIIFAALMIAALAAAFFFGSQRNEPAPAQSSLDSDGSAVLSSVSGSSEEISSPDSSVTVSEDKSAVSAIKPAESSDDVSEKSSESKVEESTHSAPESSTTSEVHAPEPEESRESKTESRPESKPESKPQPVSEQISSTEIAPSAASSPSAPEKSKAESTVSVIPAESSKDIPEAPQTLSCTLYISCATAVNNSSLDPKKLAILPADGEILGETAVSFSEGESVFDILRRICREKGIILSAPVTPFYGGGYIEGICDLHERDCGPVSGWMYSVNDKFPSVGVSSYKLKEGDVVKILYTCDLGADVGNIYTGGGWDG